LIHIFITGIFLGFFAAIIPGPINIEVIRRSLRTGPRMAYVFGIGAITADFLYVASMSFGLLALLAALPLWGKGLLSVVGGFLLSYMAWVGIMAEPPVPPDLPDESEAVIEPPKRPWTDYLHTFTTGFFLTATSPSAFGFWIAVSFPLAQQLPGLKQAMGPLFLASGVATAIAIWITFAVTVASGVYRRLRPAVIQRVEQFLGLLMAVCAALAFVEGARMLSGHDPGLNSHTLPIPVFTPGGVTTPTLHGDDLTSMTVNVQPIPLPVVEPGTTTGVLFLDRAEILQTSLATSTTTAQNQQESWFPYGRD
jgi:threonine/homoserine/homoserine lactone efflux protein